jgi:sulfur transfer protein SufE
MMTPDDFSSVELQQLKYVGNWQHQYRLLMQWGNLVSRKEGIRIEDHRLRGCAIPAWLVYADGQFYFDSDSRIINGLAALLLSVATRGSPGELYPAHWETLLLDLGLARHLTPSRTNGFRALVRRVHNLMCGDP